MDNTADNTTVSDVSFEVDISEKDLMNFKLYHNYHSFSGIALAVFGVICLCVCFVSIGTYNVAYTCMMGLFGLLFTVYTPIEMYLKVRRQMKSVKAFSEPVKYTISEEKIVLSQGDVSEDLLWDDVFRVKATGKCVILYITAVRANVIPYRCLGSSAKAFFDIIGEKLEPSQIRLNEGKVIRQCESAGSTEA